MRLTIHESVPVDLWEQCASVAARFDREYPAPHRDCIYVRSRDRPDAMTFHVTRTKTGGMTVRAWREGTSNAAIAEDMPRATP